MSRGSRSFDETWATLGPRLRARFPEIEAGLAKLVEDPDPDQLADPLYLDHLESLRANRPAILEYAVEVIERGERHAPEVPAAVLVAARRAARAGIPLETILRRYSAGHALANDILVEEAGHAEVPAPALRRLLHRQATLFDRLIEAVSEEYAREARSRPATPADWRHAYVEQLLAGRQPSGEVDLGYDLDGQHVGLMARGEGAQAALRELAKRLDRRLLVDDGEGEPISAWLGGKRPLGAEEVQRALGEALSGPIVVALGEGCEGISGWRLSHRQAKAALAIAERGGQSILRYADVAVAASILRDDLAATSLRQLYLEPLERARDGGRAWRETLRAYFATQRNLSSTAAALGVDRRTVANRIRAIEELFGRPLKDFETDLEIALRLPE